jgi:hypothetical protein
MERRPQNPPTHGKLAQQGITMIQKTFGIILRDDI